MDLNALPFPSRRGPLLAANGVVATSQPLAAQAGLRILQAGGNAVDAALATAIALTVVEPTSNGIGGDLFAIVWDGSHLHGFNGSGALPRGLDVAALREQGHTAYPEFGWPSVSVPGAPDAWAALHERFGVLDFERLFEAAIGYGQQGFPVTPVVARLWADAAARYGAMEDPAIAPWRDTFTWAGRPPACGETWSCEALAATLGLLSKQGGRAFYEGPLAEAIADFAKATGGSLRLEDLNAHRGEWVEPVSFRYRDCTVWELPPNGQGITALYALGLMAGFDPTPWSLAGAELWHRQIEAMKLAFADGYRYIADPRSHPVPIAPLLEPAYLQERRERITDRAAAPFPGKPRTSGTVYLCSADRDGMMVSLIQSNFAGFGSGVVVPGTGIALHNRAACFVLEAGHPNEAAPGKRPRHTIIPGFLTRNGTAIGPFGVMGGEMQPQGHLQVLTGMLDYGLNPQAALDMPRWQLAGGLDVQCEGETPPVTVAGLRSRGHLVTVNPDRSGFGRGQIIWRHRDGVYIAGSEPRADGLAAGY